MSSPQLLTPQTPDPIPGSEEAPHASRLAPAAPLAPLHPRLRELYRSATPTQKLSTVGRINRTLRAMKVAQLERTRPELSSDVKHRLVRRWWLGAYD